MSGGNENQRPIYFEDIEECIDEIIRRVGKKLIVAAPFGIGKPNHLLNALYRRIKKDRSLHLKLITALHLNKPRWKNELEKRLLEPMVKRLWPDYPDLIYVDELSNPPENFELIQFFFKPGARLNCPHSQQNFLCSNYTHAVRDGVIQGVNVLVQQVCKKQIEGRNFFSMSSDPDTHLEAGRIMRKQIEEGLKATLVAQTNQRAPFMYGRAVIEEDFYDMVIDNRMYDFELFHVPKEPVSLTDWSIGLRASALVKDGGTLQVGIGSLGDAVIGGLLMRHTHNGEYKNLLKDMGVSLEKGRLVDRVGGCNIFKEGLHISSEMFVDTMIELYKAGIVKRKVYDHLKIQQMVDRGIIKDKITEDALRFLVEELAIHERLTQRDVDFLIHFGIFKEGVILEGDNLIVEGKRLSRDIGDRENLREVAKYCLGDRLKNGIVINSSFFFGPNRFYEYLRSLPEEKLKEINMRGVDEVNQLYGDEELRRLQRRDGRFINAALMVMLNGAIISHTLKDSRVLSGPGGQYNFVAMAHALPDARFVIMVRTTRQDGKGVHSNIVWEYGEVTVPRHLRDIVVTEYGTADLRGRTDKEVIMELLKITDSRFQEKLLKKAKKHRKIPAQWKIPDAFKYNTPERLKDMLAPYRKKGLLPNFPFGTELTEEEIVLAGALKALSKKRPLSKIKLGTKILSRKRDIPREAMRYLERMGLERPANMKEKLLQKIVVLALKEAGKI